LKTKDNIKTRVGWGEVLEIIKTWQFDPDGVRKYESLRWLGPACLALLRQEDNIKIDLKK
jgi:hypothetical protein